MERKITVSETVYQVLEQEAARHRRSPDELAEALLIHALLPQHSYVEELVGRSGPRAVIHGTRVGVDVVLGYTRAGHAPEEIAAEILPQLTPAQVYDALSYAHDHPETFETLEKDSISAWQSRLRERMDAESYAKLTGAA